MNRRTSRQQRAFTLVEFLIAAAIASLISMVVFAIYRTAATTFESVSQDRRVFDRAVISVETLSRDLSCSARIPLNGAVFIMLDQGSQADDLNSNLSFHTATHAPTQDDTEQFQVERVSYYLRPALQGSESAQTLVRDSQVLKVDGTLEDVVRDDIAVDVDSFRVAVFDGEKWHDTWPVSDGKGPIPSAARITLSCRHRRIVKTFESVAVIRTGMPL